MLENIISELKFKFNRSSGPGGQSVNKVETRVVLLFDVMNSNILSDDQKSRISIKVGSRINLQGILSLSCEETRSQIRNKEIVINRFLKLLEAAMRPSKKRKPTFRSKTSVEKRLRQKKIISDKKKDRKKQD